MANLNFAHKKGVLDTISFIRGVSKQKMRFDVKNHSKHK